MLFTKFDIDTAIKIWKEEGKKENQVEIAKNLINVLNITDVNSISKVTGLSNEEINKLL